MNGVFFSSLYFVDVLCGVDAVNVEPGQGLNCVLCRKKQQNVKVWTENQNGKYAYEYTSQHALAISE